MTEPAVAGVASPDWEVPGFSVAELRPRSTRYCVAIFVINEGEKIRAQLTRMQPLMALADVLIADGGSTDGSLAPEFLAEQGVRTLLVKTGPGKLGAQMRMAFAYAMRQGYEGIITIDGNNKDDPSAIPAFIDALDLGADHVQGSRFIPGGLALRTPPSRLLGIRLLHAPLISRAAGFRYTDTTNGFRAYSRRFLLDERVAPFRDVFSRYELHYYLAIRAARLGFSVREIPVTRAYPSKGPTPTKISPIRGNLLVLRTLVAACLHRFDPPANATRR
jgi:glycosyltransferase involved in cell wall biosynthesis